MAFWVPGCVSLCGCGFVMASIRDRAAMYEAAAAETAAFGNILEKKETEEASTPPKMSAVAAAALRYQKLIDDLRRDQDKPGTMQELDVRRREKERRAEEAFEELEEARRIEAASRSGSTASKDVEGRTPSYKVPRHMLPSAKKVSVNKVPAQKLPLLKLPLQRLSSQLEYRSGVSSSGDVDDGDDDEFHSTDETWAEEEGSEGSDDESVIRLPELLGHEFTNDAVEVEDEQQVVVPEHVLRQRSRGTALGGLPDRVQNISQVVTPIQSSGTRSTGGEYEAGAPSVHSRYTVTSSKGSEQELIVGSDQTASDELPEASIGASFTSSVANAVAAKEHGATPSLRSIPSELASEAEDEGVKETWRRRRQQSSRIPKAKVVIARREDETGNEAVDAMEDLTAPAAPPPTRRLVKKYTTRAQLLEGRVSLVDIEDPDPDDDDYEEIDADAHYATSSSAKQRYRDRERRGPKQLSVRKNDRSRRIARRSSVVSGAIDRVSMAADPFIDFMAEHGGVAGPKKPRGTLSKILTKLFGKGRRRELLKGK